MSAHLRTILVACAVASIPGISLADSPHFVTGPTASIDSTTGDYTVSFKEAGLGTTPITYSLTAKTATFTFRCFTKSNNTPNGAPNGISISNDSTASTVTPRHGQITSSITLSPEKDGASCNGGGLRLCLVGADYTGVVFADVTDGLSFDMPDLSAGNGSTSQLECFSK